MPILDAIKMSLRNAQQRFQTNLAKSKAYYKESTKWVKSSTKNVYSNAVYVKNTGANRPQYKPGIKWLVGTLGVIFIEYQLIKRRDEAIHDLDRIGDECEESFRECEKTIASLEMHKMLSRLKMLQCRDASHIEQHNEIETNLRNSLARIEKLEKKLSKIEDPYKYKGHGLSTIVTEIKKEMGNTLKNQKLLIEIVGHLNRGIKLYKMAPDKPVQINHASPYENAIDEFKNAIEKIIQLNINHGFLSAKIEKFRLNALCDGPSNAKDIFVNETYLTTQETREASRTSETPHWSETLEYLFTHVTNNLGSTYKRMADIGAQTDNISDDDWQRFKKYKDFKESNYKKAQIVFEETLKIKDSAVVHAQLGATFKKMAGGSGRWGNLIKSIKSNMKAYKTDFSDLEVLNGYAKAIVDFVFLDSTLKQSQSVDEELKKGLDEIREMLQETVNIEEAKRIFGEILRQTPHNPIVLNNMGFGFLAEYLYANKAEIYEQSLQESINCLNQAQTVKRVDEDILGNRALARYFLRDYEGSLSDLRQYENVNHGLLNPKLLYVRGSAKLRSRKPEYEEDGCNDLSLAYHQLEYYQYYQKMDGWNLCLMSSVDAGVVPDVLKKENAVVLVHKDKIYDAYFIKNGEWIKKNNCGQGNILKSVTLNSIEISKLMNGSCVVIKTDANNFKLVGNIIHEALTKSEINSSNKVAHVHFDEYVTTTEDLFNNMNATLSEFKNSSSKKCQEILLQFSRVKEQCDAPIAAQVPCVVNQKVHPHP